MILTERVLQQTKSVPLIYNSCEKNVKNLAGILLNIMNIIRNFNSLIKKVYQIGCTHKLNRKRIKKINPEQK